MESMQLASLYSAHIPQGAWKREVAFKPSLPSARCSWDLSSPIRALSSESAES